MDNATDFWPTLEACEILAISASAAGFEIELMQDGPDGWIWTWLHVESGMSFDGETTARTKEVALVCALMSVPVVR
jgi:hypothetical protein